MNGVLEGVPSDENKGHIVLINFTAIGNNHVDSAKDLFAIDILPHTFTQRGISPKVIQSLLVSSDVYYIQSLANCTDIIKT